MITYFFTFGQTHRHPDTQIIMKDYWIEIITDSSDSARKKMFEIFGNKWGFQYTESKFMEIYHMFSGGCYARYELD